MMVKKRFITFPSAAVGSFFPKEKHPQKILTNTMQYKKTSKNLL